MVEHDKDGLVDYFISHTNTRLANIEGKLDSVLKFKWQIIGGAGVAAAFLSILVTICIQLVTFFVNNKIN